MGRDFSLSDRYPSVLINGRKYHYGRDPEYGEYLVESATYEKDYWHFKEKEDLQAFLVNLPESADHRARILAAYPDWHDVTHERRTAYLADDRAGQRSLAEEKIRTGTAQSFNLDLDGEHGPHEPQRILAASTDSPLARVERQLAAFKAVEAANAKQAGYPVGPGEWPAGYTEALKLRVLEGEVDWSGVAANDKEALLAREVDFGRITAEQFAFVYQDIAFDYREPADASVAQALFDRSRAQETPPPIRGSTRSLILAVTLDTWPSNAAVVDFGIGSREHYEALYYPLRHGDFTPQQLDAALGDGRKLTALVDAAPHNPHKGIVFSANWPLLPLDPEHPPEPERPAADTKPRPPSPSEIARDATERKSEPARENGQDHTPHPEPSRGR